LKWLVQLVDQLPYNKSVSCIVEAETMPKAVEKAMEKYPEMGFSCKALAISDFDTVVPA